MISEKDRTCDKCSKGELMPGTDELSALGYSRTYATEWKELWQKKDALAYGTYTFNIIFTKSNDLSWWCCPMVEFEGRDIEYMRRDPMGLSRDGLHACLTRMQELEVEAAKEVEP